MGVRQLPRQILLKTLRNVGPFARLALAAVLCAAVSGCGVGALIGGAVVGVMAALDDDDSSGPSIVPAVSSLFEPLREHIRAQGDSTTIPLCIGRTDDTGEVTVQYSPTVEDDWRTARLVPRPAHLTPPECEEGEAIYWWDAESDLRNHHGLDLNETSERVKVRAFMNGDTELAQTSRSFQVGNSPPKVFLRATSPGANEILITVDLFDDEDDPLIEPSLWYRIANDQDWRQACQASSTAVGNCETPCPDFVPDGDILPVGTTRFFWRTHCVEGIRQRNLDVEVKVEAVDDFGIPPILDPLSISVRNNRPPEVTIVNSGNRDRSFEIPVFFRLTEHDCEDPQDTNCSEGFQTVDIIVQYSLQGGDDILPLDEQFEEEDFRRRILDPDLPVTSELAEIRRDFSIATPKTQAWALRATPDGVQHLFLWDSSRDLPRFAANLPVTLQITPYDEVKGTSDKTFIEVDNDIYPDQQTLVQNRGPIGGIAIGDLNKDGRVDQVYSLSKTGELETGEILLCLADDFGPRKADDECFSFRLEGEFAPLELVVVDLNGDSLQDLVVLDRNCPPANCNKEGEIHIYYGMKEAPFLEEPPLTLTAGRDVRSVCVGNFDDLPGLDIAVSNHDDVDVRVFLNRPQIFPGANAVANSFEPQPDICLAVPVDCPSAPAIREPGLLICADFDQDGLDEIAVRLRKADLVEILDWETVDDLKAGNVTLTARVAAGAKSLATADFDADGWPDLAVGTTAAPFLLLFQNTSQLAGEAGISFRQIPAEFHLEHRVEQIRVARLPNPGEFLFAMITDKDSGTAEFVHGVFRDGPDSSSVETTSFKSIRLPVPDPSSNLPASLAAHDVDGDGLVDVFLGGLETAIFLRGEGPGSLAPRLTRRLGLPKVTSLTFLDRSCSLPGSFVAVRSQLEDRRTFTYDVSVFLQDAQRGFIRDRERPGRKITQNRVYLATGADRTGESCTDIIAVSHRDGIALFVGDDGQFPVNPVESPQDRLAEGPIVLGDLSEPAGIDLVEMTPVITDEGNIVATLSLKDIDLSTAAEDPLEDRGEPLSTGEPFDEARLLSGDVNGDGWLDLVITHREFAAIHVQDRSLRWPENLRYFQSVDLTLRVEFADLTHVNNDDTLDLIVVGGSPKRLLVFHSTGDPAALFLEPLEVPLPNDTLGVALTDFSNDGLADIVLSRKSTSGRDTILNLIFFNKKTKKFPELPARSITLAGFGLGRVHLGVADVTNDSRSEVIVYGPQANDTWVLESR